MATLINNAGVQHYANKMVLAENRKVGSKSLPTALSDIDNLIDEMKTQFDTEYGSALDMKLENNENVFIVGTGTNVDKSSEVENSFTDVELSGNSLVNLWVKRDGSANLNDVVNNTNNEYAGVIKAGSDCGFTSHISNIKSDTYTVIFDLKTDSTLAKPKIMFFDYGGLANAQNTTLSTAIPNTGWNTYMLTKSVTKTNGSTVLVGVNCPSSEIGIQLSVRNVMILEGDWTNKPIPQYFEGMKSVGQDDENGHKIEILSQNKNLLTQDKYETWGNEVSIKYSGNVEKYVECSKTPFKVKPNMTYTFSTLMKATSNLISSEIYLYEYRKGETRFFKATPKQFSTNSILDFKRVSYTFTTTNETDRILLRFDNNGSLDGNTATLTCKEYCLSLGDNTTYVEGKLNKKEISLNEPLRGLPNGIRDTIEKVNGEWKIVRRCHETILDGSEDWRSGGYTNTDIQELYLSPDKLIPSTNKRGVSGMSYNNYISNNFPTIQGNIATSNRWLAINGIGGLTLALPKDELAEPYFASAKQWLSQNPTKVVYELETPIIENISPVTLQCWKNGTISIDEVLPVETTHTVALNKPAQIKRNIEELTVLRKRVQALEDFYDQVALEQSHQLSLINNSIELDYDI